MIFLAIFGPTVEDAVGRARFCGLLAFWFAEQLYFALAGLATAGGIGTSGEGVAYLAHLVGFTFGLLVIRALVTRRGRQPRLPVY